MPSNISWSQSCFYNAWSSSRGFESEALQLWAHIKYSRQLPCRLKRFMPLDLSGLTGKQTTVWIPKRLLFGKKTPKLVVLCLGYFQHLQFYDRIWWWLSERHFTEVSTKGLFSSRFTFSWFPRKKDFAAVFLATQAYVSMCWFFYFSISYMRKHHQRC